MNISAKHQVKIKFVIVGVWNTIFGYLSFLGLEYFFSSLIQKRYIAYMSAAVLSNILSIINAFIFHKYITFKSIVTGKKIFLEFNRFFSTYIFTTVLGLVSLPFFVEILNISPRISALLLIPIIPIISYWGHLKFSFRKNGSIIP